MTCPDTHPFFRPCRRAGLFAVAAVLIACSAPDRPDTESPARSPARKREARSHSRPSAKPPPCRGVGSTERGKGVWYGGKHHGRPTASGERFNKHAMTAAHKTLPMGAVVRVTNLANHRSVTVRINDRGPYSKGRIIDVSEAAARSLDMIRAGVVPVEVEVVKLPPGKARKRCR